MCLQGPVGFPGDPGPPGEPGTAVSAELIHQLIVVVCLLFFFIDSYLLYITVICLCREKCIYYL